MFKKKKDCLLSFHDISIDNFDAIVPLIEEIRLLSGSPFALLVIPDTQKASLERIEAFKKQLRDWEQDGFEILLHGCSHTSLKSFSRSYQGRMAQLLTHGEAEFAGLNLADSSFLFEKALTFWNTLVLTPPKTFIPPAWYGNPFLPSLVLKHQIQYEGRFYIQTNKRRLFSGAISFAGLVHFLIPIAFFYGRLLLRLPFGIPRIALHPVDFPNQREHIHNLIRFALGERQWIHYKDL